MDYCGATDMGGRKNNEDAYIAISLTNRLYLFAVADGLGGHRAGEVASALAVQKLGEVVKNGAVNVNSSESMKELLAGGFRKTNKEILNQASAAPERLGMGTTLVAALLDDEGKGVIANIGDSRAYLIGNNITRITKDHSYVQELVDRGVITQEEAAVHLQKNIVTRIIGMEDAEPDFFDIELDKNTLLLCSDGLTDALGDEEIREVVISSKIESMCKNLVESAKPVSRDNITVVVAKR